MKRLVAPYYFFGLLLSFALERGLFIIFLGDLNYTNTQISILQVTFFVTCFLAEIPTGMISDALGRKYAVGFGSLFMGLGVGLQYYAGTNFWLMITAFIIHASAFAFVSGAITALLYDELKAKGQEDKYSFLLSSYSFLQSMGLAIAMFGAGFFKEMYSWKELYYLSALLQALSVFPVFFMKEYKHQPDTDLGFFKSFFKGSKDLFPVILPISLIHAAMTPYFVFSQKLFQSFDISIASISGIIGSIEFVSAFIVLLISYLSAKFARKRLLFLLFLFSFFLASHYFITKSTTWLVISVGLFLVCSAIVMYIAIISDSYYQSQITDESKRASIMSFASFLDTAIIGVGYFYYGLFLDNFDANIAIAASALFPAISFLMIKKGKTYGSI